MTMIDWGTVMVALVGSGSVIYLIIDKLVLSKREKVDALAAQSSALETTINQLTDHNKYLTEQIAQKDEQLKAKDDHYAELIERFHKLNDECGSTKTELYNTKELLQYYKDRHCRVCGCVLREPPSDIMSGDPTKVKKEDSNDDHSSESGACQ